MNSFIKNVSVLASGAIIGQIVVILASPILTRLYTVEAFGILSVFTSVCTILSLFSTGRFELAIVLPKLNENALKLIKLIFYIAIFVSFFYFIVIFISKEILKVNDSIGFLKYLTAYAAPLYIFFVALLSALSYWNQRKKAYKTITIANALQSISNTIISLALGFLIINNNNNNNNNGMIWGLVGGIVVTVGYLILKDKYLVKNVFRTKGVKEVAQEYKAFPKYMIFSDLSLNTNQQITPILFSHLYNSTIVGHYSLANRILRLPNIIVTSSVANVFRNDAIDEIRNKNNCKELYISTFKKLFLIAFPVYLTVFLISPFIFQFIFGESWGMAGEFGRIISLYLFFEFIATPLNTLFYIREQQKKLMLIQISNLIMSITMIVLGAKLFGDPRVSLLFYTINSIFFNLLLLLKSYKLSKQI